MVMTFMLLLYNLAYVIYDDEDYIAFTKI